MKLFSLPIFFITLLSFSSCAFLNEKINQWMPENSPTNVVSKNNTGATDPLNYCPLGKQGLSKMQLLVENEDVLKFYKQLNTHFFSNPKYSFPEKAIMLTLSELMRRPDRIGPQSRFQFFIRHNNENYYFDFRPKDKALANPQPLLNGLNYMNSLFNKNAGLYYLAQEIEKILPKEMMVSNDFEIFLKKNYALINKNDYFYENFFKGDEVITHFETFKRGSLTNLVKNSLTNKNFNINQYNFDEKAIFTHNSNLNCNFNVTDEMNYLKAPSYVENRKSHSIALEEGNNVFLAVASFEIDEKFTQAQKDFYFFNAKPSSAPYPFCHIANKKVDLNLFSVEGRNPEQFMQHLISYEIQKVSSQEEVNQIINFSRHLFLSNPDRILYESKKGRAAQLNFFLTMNFPIYHADNLGNIFGQAKIINNSKTLQSLHSDPRTQASIWCQ